MVYRGVMGGSFWMGGRLGTTNSERDREVQE